ncbi:MAG: alpha/beta fold hydrolase [Smithella sp.]|nr:alpha/beta fold hydrolase [Smithella sp.]
MKKLKADFFSKGIRCDGDLYLPEGVKNPPVVIMAHGLSAVKAFRLPAFAERFVEKGMATFLFDYRTFGQSDGEPRHVVNPFHHVQDWLAAIAHVRNLPEVDASRIALWGTSFSGGHVILAATKDAGIKAVVSQGPFVSGFSSIRMRSISDIILATVYGMTDYIKTAFLLPPHYSPAIAQPGTFAAMNSEESYPGFRSIIPEGSKWENKMTSRAFILMAFYYPVYYAKKVKAPVLLIGGKNDSLVPFSVVKKTAERLPNCEFVALETNHFEPYTGARFEQSIKIQIDFLGRKLLGKKV